MGKEILLTVFVVTFNRENYLRSCIKSILEQTYYDFQLIILDNASTDNTQNTVESFNDNRIQYKRHDKNIGGIKNINYAIKMCTTKYFVIFHDDDIMNKDMLEKELNEFEKNEEYSIVSSLSTYIDGKNNQVVINEKKHDDRISLFKGNEYLRNFLLGRQGIICPSVMYRNSFFKERELIFRLEVGPAADQYLWFEVEKNGGILCRINEPLIKYRLHGTQDSQISSSTMLIELLKAINKLIKNDPKIKELFPLLERRSIQLSLSASRKYADKQIGYEMYCEIIDNLINEVCQTHISHITLKFIKWITVRNLFVVGFSYKFLKHLILSNK